MGRLITPVKAKYTDVYIVQACAVGDDYAELQFSAPTCLINNPRVFATCCEAEAFRQGIIVCHPRLEKSLVVVKLPTTDKQEEQSKSKSWLDWLFGR